MLSVSTVMGNQLISLRLKDEEVALLMQQAKVGENPSLTAQRLIRQILGTQEIPPDGLTSLLTQVGEFQEQVKSIKNFVDDSIEQRLAALDKLVNETVNQNMKAELLQVRSRFDELEQRWDKYFQIQRQQSTLSTPKLQQSKLPSEPLNHSELARRLINPKTGHPYSHSAISRYKDRVDFARWSQERDPQGVGWEYDTRDGLFYPLIPS
ncbi:MAG TPA: hypothetical protein V6D14_14225 [Coleofasciculaceae cyanobacterium]